MDDRFGGHVSAIRAARRESTILAARDHESFDLALQHFDRRLEVRNARERFGFGLVRKQYVDATIVQQSVEAVTMPVDAERIGQGEGNLAPGLVSDLDRAQHRIARSLRIPKVAF